MGKGNTYQCKQDCGISHFGNHEIHDFDVPRNKAMHLICLKTHTHSPKFLTTNFSYPKFCIPQIYTNER